jgi:hypothetical protein
MWFLISSEMANVRFGSMKTTVYHMTSRSFDSLGMPIGPSRHDRADHDPADIPLWLAHYGQTNGGEWWFLRTLRRGCPLVIAAAVSFGMMGARSVRV